MYSACLKCIFRQPPPPPPTPLPRRPFSFPSLERGSARNGGSGMEWRHCTRVPINSDAAFSPHGRQPTFSIARIWQKEWERLNSFPEDLAAGSQLDIPSGPVQAGLAGCFSFLFFFLLLLMETGYRGPKRLVRSGCAAALMRPGEWETRKGKTQFSEV